MSGHRAVVERHVLRHPDGRQFYVYGRFDGSLDDQPAGGGGDPRQLQRRFDRLTGAWVHISPSRNLRPGGTVTAATRTPCPLCPGGVELPWPYDVAVFDNRFPSLSPSAPMPPGPLAAASTGRCQVVVYTPDHSHRSLSELSPEQLVGLLAVLRERTRALWEDGHEYVMAFENRGSEVGATLDHLHGQIYAFDYLPPTIHTKLAAHHEHRRDEQRCLGCTLVTEATDREIVANASFSVAVPYAARWPLEVHIRARAHGVLRLAELTDTQLLDLARALDDVVARYDGLYGTDLPYMMCVQEAPTGPATGTEDWHLHIEFLPPHRSVDRLKVRASVETALGVFINDTLPEDSAAALAAVEVPSRAWNGAAIPRFEDAR